MKIGAKISPISLYLLVLMLLSVNCWNIKPLSFLFTGSRGLFLFLAVLFVGCCAFRKRESRSFFNLRNNTPALLILLGIVLSFIPAKVYYGQTIFASVIAVRRVSYYFTLPVLLLIRPSIQSIKRALVLFSVLFFVMVILCIVLGFDIITLSEEQMIRKETSANGYSAALEGFMFVAMGFVLSLFDFLRCPSLRNTAVPVLCLISLMLYQNRTAIFACLFCGLWMLLALPNTKKLLKIKVASLTAVVAVLCLFGGILRGLVEETIFDLTNSSYNRSLAYVYFLKEAPQGIMSVLLGNGFISSKVSTIMTELMEEGIYNSDVGLVGLWNQFGVLPVLTILAVIIVPFIRRLPSQVKALSILTICFSLTVGYFFASQTMVWLCLYLYIIVWFTNRKLWMSR